VDYLLHSFFWFGLVYVGATGCWSALVVDIEQSDNGLCLFDRIVLIFEPL
jgi:hypothetical protein